MFNNGNYKLGDFCILKKGKHYPKTTDSQFWNGTYDWLTIKDIQPHITSSVQKLSQLGVETVKNYQQHSFKKDTFVMAFYGATVGKMGWLQKDCFASPNVFCFNTGQYVTNLYLYFWMLKHKRKILNLVRGSAIPYISVNQIQNLKINLPSFQQQQKIIDIIEPIKKLYLKFSKCVRIDNFYNAKEDIMNLIDIIEPLEKIYIRLNALEIKINKLQNKLVNSFIDLVVHSNDYKLEEVMSNKPIYGAGQKALKKGEWKYFRQSDISLGYPVFFVDKHENKFMKKGDFFISRAGTIETYYHNHCEKWVFAGYLVKYPIDNKKAISKYVYYWTKSYLGQKMILKNSLTGSTMPKLNPPIALKLKLKLPPILKQQKIVDIIDPMDKIFKQPNILGWKKKISRLQNKMVDLLMK